MSVVCTDVYVQLQPLNSSGIEPDRAVLRITKESEIRQGHMLGAGAFGTVYRVCPIQFYSHHHHHPACTVSA